jgi:hypothetical protein
MASLTAVELGADICALARTSVRRDEIHLLAAETIDPAAFPGIESLALAIRQIRRSMRLPRRCRAVIWGLPDGASRTDAAVKPLLAPLVGAGFKVERVVSPCNALAALARLRTARQGATIWLAINRGGVALVAVRPGEQLYSHWFAWDSSLGATGSQARLLQRYSLVAFLAPQIRRAMAIAREKGSPVEAIVTCGNLPDLRSMTMPLIEELDVEVETLDSLEGLTVKPAAADRLQEMAPAIRIACAGAISRATRAYDPSKKRSRFAVGVVPAIAAAAGVCGLAWVWYARTHELPSKPIGHVALAPSPNLPRTGTTGSPAPKRAMPTRPEPGPVAPLTRAPVLKVESKPPAVSVPIQKPPPTAVPKPQPIPAVRPALKPQAKPAAPAQVHRELKPESKPPVLSVPPRSPKPIPLPPVFNAPGRTAVNPGPLNVPVRRADKPVPAGAARPPAAPLRDPVPHITAILVSSDRRLATIDDGHIIAVGDLVGRRVVASIDEHSVLFREPSGLQIRVGLGGRLIGTER